MWNPSLVDGPIPDDGGRYLLNVAPQCVTSALTPYVVRPSTPNRVFSGAETVFLRFADEQQARAALPGLWVEE